LVKKAKHGIHVIVACNNLKLTYAGFIVHLYRAKLVMCVNMSAIFRPLCLRT